MKCSICGATTHKAKNCDGSGLSSDYGSAEDRRQIGKTASSLQRLPPCRSCSGHGFKSCPYCTNGIRTVTRRRPGVPGTYKTTERCDTCHGTGRSECSACFGTGKQGAQGRLR